MSLLDGFGSKLNHVPVLNISPEAYGLPPEMDPMAQYVFRKGGGGLGDIIRGILVELYARGIEGYYLGPNYKKIFQDNSGLSSWDYIQKVHSTPNEQIILLSSTHFSYLNRIYDGDTALSAALLQDLALPHIKEINGNHGRRSIVHTHDQSAGIIPAFCKSRKIPSVHTLHNGFTYHIPYSKYPHADLTEGDWGLKQFLYDTYPGSGILDSHATAVKNADIITFVGKRFLDEILEGRYDNWNLFSNAKNTFSEVKFKAAHNRTRVVMNGIASEELPENQNYIKMSFGPNTQDIWGAKKQNMLEFQEKMGLEKNDNVIMLYWSSRIEESQKGIESLLYSALDVLAENPNVQIAIVGDDATPDKKYNPWIQNLISQAKEKGLGNRIAHRSFDKQLSNLGYASASAIIGASHYEPFGLFWLQGVCAGAFGIGAENGGAVDILREFNVSKNYGNGFFYKNTNAGGLKYAMQKTIDAINLLQKNPELYNKQLKRMMIQARNDFSITKMVEGYIDIYQELGIAYNLFTDGYIPFKQVA